MVPRRAKALLLQLDSIRRFLPVRNWAALPALLLLAWFFACQVSWYYGLLALGVVCGFVRALRAVDQSGGYERFLSLAPWTPAMPLPFATPWLVWQDALLLAMLTGATFLADEPQRFVTAYPTGFLAGFLFYRTAALGVIWSGMFGAIMLAGWLIMFTCAPLGPAVVLGILVAMLVVDHAATHRGMLRLHAERMAPLRCGALPPPSLRYDASELSELCGRTKYESCTVAHAWFAGIASGWAAFLLARFLTTTGHGHAYACIGMIAVTAILVIGRIGKYFGGGATPPVPLRTRIALCRPILPDYDRVFVAPLLVLVLGAMAVARTILYGMPPAAIGAVVAVLVLLTCMLGPSLRAFRLTSRFHMTISPPWSEEDDEELETAPGKAPAPEAAPRQLKSHETMWLELARRLAPKAEYFTHWSLAWMVGIGLADAVIVAGAVAMGTLSLDRDMHSVPVFAVFVLAVVTWCGLVIAWPRQRLRTFHPLACDGYMEWLRQMPWKPGMPLPLGPMRWTRLDSLVLAVLAVPPALLALAMVCDKDHDRRSHLWIAWGFAALLNVVFLFTAAGLLRRMGQRAPLVALALLGGLLFHRVPWPGQMTAVLLCMTLVAVWGIARGWRGYPWKNTWGAPSDTYCPGRFRREPLHEIVGPAVQYLSGRCVPLVPRRGTRVMCIVVAAWWVYVAASQPYQIGNTAPWVILAIAAMYRMAAYRGAARTPYLGLAGRLRTGRLIIPKYDCVYAAPLAALVAWFVLVLLARKFGVPHYAATPATVAVVLSILCFAPPSLRRWRLLGLF